MVLDEHINLLGDPLLSILSSELNLGNEIAETSKGWPEEETIIVFLRKPFIGTYCTDAVDFVKIDDPHYWKSEYSDKTTKNVLACKFEQN